MKGKGDTPGRKAGGLNILCPFGLFEAGHPKVFGHLLVDAFAIGEEVSQPPVERITFVRCEGEVLAFDQRSEVFCTLHIPLLTSFGRIEVQEAEPYRSNSFGAEAKSKVEAAAYGHINGVTVDNSPKRHIVVEVRTGRIVVNHSGVEVTLQCSDQF